MNGSRSVRGFVLFLLCYGGARTAIIWAPDLHPVRLTTAAVAQKAMPATVPPSPRTTSEMPYGADTSAPPLPLAFAKRQEATLLPRDILIASTTPARTTSARLDQTGAVAARSVARLVEPPRQATALEVAPVGLAQSFPPQAPPNPTNPNAASNSRWSGYAYLFHRADRAGPATLAPAGQIGGSQAAARIAYHLDNTPLALAARIATPLRDTRQAEVAAGLDLVPVSNLRISVERRIAIGRDGRDAFAAYAAGGLYRAIAPRLELDGYAQAGFVGIERRDPFADGALRIHHRTAIGATTDLRLGAGAWGAAQPGAARLDIGPRLAVTTRTARLPVTLAIEGRLRVAGRARPGDGIALTLVSDF